jgi:hypothetical protein
MRLIRIADEAAIAWATGRLDAARDIEWSRLIAFADPRHPDSSLHRANYFARRHRRCRRSAGWLP